MIVGGEYEVVFIIGFCFIGKILGEGMMGGWLFILF